MLAHDIPELTPDERRHAVCIAMALAPGLIRFAARYTHDLDDAEDAYQRAMEITLTSAPTLDRTDLLRWLHTVLRREAATIARARVTETPFSDEELDETFAERQMADPEPHALVEWRERYRALQDGFLGLTESQRVCLMFTSAGVSHGEIVGLTGFSERKVLRSITEGRARLQAWEVRLATGEECSRIGSIIDSGLAGSERRERRLVSRHVRHCQACRVRFRTQREQERLLGSMVPVALLGSDLLTASPPDPSFAMSWWERVSGSATVKTGQAIQLMTDLPAIASTKAGASALAAAAAGAIGTPVVIDAVREPARPTRPAIAQVATPAAHSIPTADRAATAPASTQVPARKKTATARATTRTVRTTTRRATARVTSPPRITRAPRATTKRPATAPSAALEFGP